MKIQKKIVNIGDSIGIIIDTVIANSLKIKKGDLVEITIKKL
jgi:hypothetical protein